MYFSVLTFRKAEVVVYGKVFNENGTKIRKICTEQFAAVSGGMYRNRLCSSDGNAGCGGVSVFESVSGVEGTGLETVYMGSDAGSRHWRRNYRYADVSSDIVLLLSSRM